MPSGPTTLALPAFTGATRRLILINLAVFFGDALLSLILPARLYQGILVHLVLLPTAVAHGQIWQLLTYAFLPLGITGTIFAMLTLWFVGALLEEVRGDRWLTELYLTSAIGGALLAVAFTYTRLLHLDPGAVLGVGPYAALFGLLLCLAVLRGDEEFLVLFVIRVKIKYLVAIYLLINIAQLLKNASAFAALLNLAGALCGFLFLRFVPRRGLTYAFTERYFATRNEFYRNKRRRAAKKFEVYMSKQGREVRFDKDGRYVDPDENKDPTDKRWMN